VDQLNNELGVELATRSRRIRMRVLEAVFHAGKGHLGGALSIVDILGVLYFGGLLKLGLHSEDGSSDRFILSKGHAGVALYATLVEAGWLLTSGTPVARNSRGGLCIRIARARFICWRRDGFV
jgi:transketolase